MEVGFSTCHLYQADPDFLEWSAKNLDHMKYERFEICHEHGVGLGAVDDYIHYKKLTKINSGRLILTDQIPALRKVLVDIKKKGHEITFWSHELAAPDNILELYPELSTPHGDLNLAHPQLSEWLQDKYTQFFKAVPEIDAIVLVMTEVKFAVAHRFDNKWSKTECIHWLIKNLYDTCKINGKKLIVRPFSAITEDYTATRNALSNLPDDIEIMLKTDPFDWDPFLPINPELTNYPPERVTAEFDLGSEYFGRGLLPVAYPDYIRERIDYIKKHNINRAVARIDRRGVSALDREGLLNIEWFCEYTSATQKSEENVLKNITASSYKTTDPGKLSECFRKAFEVVKHIFYIDGQLLWHSMYGDLSEAQRSLMFELLRPGISLSHARDEWHILDERMTPSIMDVRKEKREAVALAEELRKDIYQLAPEEKQLCQRADNLVAVAEIYMLTVVFMQEYLISIDNNTVTDEFSKGANMLKVAADRLSSMPESAIRKIGIKATEIAEQLSDLLIQELRIIRNAGDCIDLITVGYPGEGHFISKFTHGSSVSSDETGCYRIVNQYLMYTAKSRIGNNLLMINVSGVGSISIDDGVSSIQKEWNSIEWKTLSIPFESKKSSVRLRIDRIEDLSPSIANIRIEKI